MTSPSIVSNLLYVARRVQCDRLVGYHNKSSVPEVRGSNPAVNIVEARLLDAPRKREDSTISPRDARRQVVARGRRGSGGYRK